MGEYVLEMNNITKVFPGVKALDGVTLKAVSYTHLTLPTNSRV